MGARMPSYFKVTKIWKADIQNNTLTKKHYKSLKVGAEYARAPKGFWKCIQRNIRCHTDNYCPDIRRTLMRSKECTSVVEVKMSALFLFSRDKIHAFMLSYYVLNPSKSRHGTEVSSIENQSGLRWSLFSYGAWKMLWQFQKGESFQRVKKANPNNNKRLHGKGNATIISWATSR